MLQPKKRGACGSHVDSRAFLLRKIGTQGRKHCQRQALENNPPRQSHRRSEYLADLQIVYILTYVLWKRGQSPSHHPV